MTDNTDANPDGFYNNTTSTPYVTIQWVKGSWQVVPQWWPTAVEVEKPLKCPHCGKAIKVKLKSGE